jgi:hypothetical protein
MKAAKIVLGLALVFTLAVVVRAADDKDKDKDKESHKTLKGDLLCAKCNLHEDFDKCVNALRVKDGDKEVVYYLDDKGKKEPYHVCGGSKKATVTGVVTEKDGKMYLKPDRDGVKLGGAATRGTKE